MRESRLHYMRALAVSSVAIFILGGGTIGATLAYFSAKKAGSAHIKAGSIDIGFFYDGAYGKLVGEGESRLKEVSKADGTLATPVDLGKVSTPAIDINNAIPGLDATYMFHVNNIATVDFSWSVGFIFDTNAYGNSPLLDALKITLANGSGEVASFFASKFVDPSFKLEYTMGELNVGSAQDDFTLNLSLDYDNVGNEIVGAEMKFDLFVEAKSLNA